MRSLPQWKGNRIAFCDSEEGRFPLLKSTIRILSIVSSLGVGLAHATVACPLGTEKTTREMGHMTSQWCAFADGTRHGPSVLVDANGALLESGNWSQGQRDGAWSRYTAEGVLTVSGQYEKGQRVGTWTNVEPDTEWSLTRHYENLETPVQRAHRPDNRDWVWWSIRIGRRTQTPDSCGANRGGTGLQDHLCCTTLVWRNHFGIACVRIPQNGCSGG